ncbi:putative reverse transcriptase domain-containing protein [Tanacetum coccineum]|uniref:Reverse transcriptase domain-containing protein n=1 Tax=Tanacetum coccineum TaxID=301880 RepID=A0ABQ4WZK7_9ASTR
MDQKLRTYAERQTNNKGKADDSSRNNHGHQQQPFKRQNVAKVYNMGIGEKKPYGGSLPKCTKCNFHHNGLCTQKFHKCNKVGRFARDYRSSANTNVANTQKGNGENPKGNGCFECGAPGHFTKDCPKLKDKDGGNRSAQGWVYAIGNAEKKVMSSSPHSTITSSEFDMENAFSSMNVHNYTSASSATSGSTSFNSSEDFRDGMIPPTFSRFYNNPYLKNVQAFYAKESPIPPPDPITPPAILTPSPILPPSLLIPPKRMSTSEAPDLTHATIEELVAHSIVVILKAQAAMMASTNNPNSEPRKTSVARKYDYEKFTSYQLFYFNGTDGAVGLIHWFKRTESIFSRSKCAGRTK